MAGRFLPQSDVDLITRVTRELVGDKQNNIVFHRKTNPMLVKQRHQHGSETLVSNDSGSCLVRGPF